MIRQIKLLTWLKLVNLFGFNEARKSCDRKKRAKLIAMLALYGLLVLMLMAYVGLMCYGVVKLRAGSAVPLCLAALSCLVALVFTVLRAGPALYETGDYEMLISLPVRPTAVVVSRFAALYFSNAAMTLAVLVPGMAICGVMMRPHFGFYPMMLLGALILPLVPMTIAMLLGMLVYMISSRLKRRNFAVLVLSLLATLAVMLLPMQLAKMQPERLILSIRGLLDGFRSFYPPAGWFGDAVMAGNWGAYLLFALGSIVFFGIAAGVVGWKFRGICDRLNSQRGRRDFRMTAQSRAGVCRALYRREIRRWLASPIYVLNTGIGYLMAVLLGVAVIFAGVGAVLDELPIPLEFAPRMLAFVLAFCYTLSPVTSSTISLEGKSWWLVKSLPVPVKAVMDSKLLVNLALALPCWLVSTLLLLIGLRTEGMESLWLILLPLGYILFSSCLGLRLNLSMPLFTWKNESQPVKQGKPVALCMLCGMASAILPAVLMVFIPSELWDAFSAALLLGLFVGAALLYRSCIRCDLSGIN